MNGSATFFTITMFRKELLLIGAMVGSVLILPVLVVVSLTATGLGGVSAALVGPSATTDSTPLHSADGENRGNFSAPRSWPAHGVVTLEFGESDFPYQVHHTGIDIANVVGTPVSSFAAGTVMQTGTSISQGNFVVIDHGQGISSRYLHLSRIFVHKGEAIGQGASIGQMGSTGFSTGPHLHFEIRVAEIPTNPRSYLKGNP